MTEEVAGASHISGLVEGQPKMAVKKTDSKKAPKAGAKKSAVKKSAPKKTADATAKKATAKKAAPKKATAPKKKTTAPKKAAPKLNDRQKEILKKIAAAVNYPLVAKAEQRTIEALAERKLVKKGKKIEGKVVYQITKAGEKQLAPAPM